MSPCKQVRKAAGFILLAALAGGGAGCKLTTESSTSATKPPRPTQELTPIQAYDKYLLALADGNEERIRGFIHVHPGEGERARLEGSISVLGSAARLRKAFDRAYGTGRLVKLGFHCHTPESHLPAESSFKIEGDHATVSAPGWGNLPMVRAGDIWKEDFIPWNEILRARAEAKDSESLPLDRLLANLRALSQFLDQTADEVRAGTYLSAADAFGVLNARLRGQARYLAPLGIAYAIDLTFAGRTAVLPSVPVVELRGDPAGLGKSQGSQLGDDIRTLLHDYMTRAFDLGQEAGRRKYKQALEIAAGFEPYIRPEHRAEISALAASIGLDPAEVMLGQCFPDLNPDSACSTVALPASASADGIARFGRNLDYTTFGVLERHSLLLVFHPTGRYAFASVSAPGLVGVLSGMNEHGLCVAAMEVHRPFRSPDAMPFMLLYRTLLENCRTVAEAIALLEKTPRQSANNLMLMDASGDRAVAEITPSKVTTRRASNMAALVSTNHQRGGDLDSPERCERFDFLHDASRRQFGRLSEVSVEEMLAGAAQGDMTFQSMVLEPVNRILYLAVGAGAPSHGFKRIDLKPYFP